MITNERIAEIAAQKRTAIHNLQSIKIEARIKADELYNTKNSQKQVNNINSQEREIAQYHPLDLFPTPADLAERMVILADIHPGNKILEPSAGTGRIAEAIRKQGFNPDCIELNYEAVKLLQSKNFDVRCMDFLDCNDMYDRIIMNPPFKDDIEHVSHAFELLREGGCIIAIMCEGVFSRQDKKSTKFREWLDDYGTSEKLPPATFKTSGTLVNARLVIINK